MNQLLFKIEENYENVSLGKHRKQYLSSLIFNKYVLSNMIYITLQGSGPWKIWYPRDSITPRMTQHRSMPSVAFLSLCRWLGTFQSEDETRTAQGDGNALAILPGAGRKKKIRER